MKNIIFFILLSSICFSNVNGHIFARIGASILYGRDAKLGEFPFVAKVYQNGQFYCTASLIGPRHVLTAAHCVQNDDKTPVKKLKITLGEYDTKNPNQSLIITPTIQSVHVHPNYSSTPQFHNDIAVLALDSIVKYHYNVRAIAVSPNQSDWVGADTVVAGWGLNEYDKLPNILQTVNLSVVDNDICRGFFTRVKITAQQLCIYSPERSPCVGDSGGPLLIYNQTGYPFQIGITSYGLTWAGCVGYPMVFVRVNQYLTWTEEIISKL